MTITVRMALLLAATMAVTALPADDAAARDRSRAPISLSMRDADVRHVVGFLAREGGFNVVMSESAQGRVTLYLNKVSIRRALSAVLHAAGLDMIRRGPVVLVMTREEVSRHLEAQARRFELAPPPPIILGP